MLTLSHCTNHGPLKSNGRHGLFGKHIESGSWPELRRVPPSSLLPRILSQFLLPVHLTITAPLVYNTWWKLVLGLLISGEIIPILALAPASTAAKALKKGPKVVLASSSCFWCLLFFLAPTVSDTVDFVLRWAKPEICPRRWCWCLFLIYLALFFFPQQYQVQLVLVLASRHYQWTENPEILKAWVAWAAQCFVLGLICHHDLESDDVVFRGVALIIF